MKVQAAKMSAQNGKQIATIIFVKDVPFCCRDNAHWVKVLNPLIPAAENYLLEFYSSDYLL